MCCITRFEGNSTHALVGMLFAIYIYRFHVQKIGMLLLKSERRGSVDKSSENVRCDEIGREDVISMNRLRKTDVSTNTFQNSLLPVR